MEGSKKHDVGEDTLSTDLIIRQREPTNLEMPFDRVDAFLTPTKLFYVRSHFPAPKFDLASYRLSIDGAVRHPLALSYGELRDMPREMRVATLECAGNSRVFLVPPVEGVQWELGAVGTAEWTGVPLAALLERAGLEEHACEIVLEGADRGTPVEQPVPPGPISYVRSLPRAKAMQRDVLIAYQMNGEDLSEDHGYPVRAIVPGHLWNGVRQVADAHPGCTRAVSGLLADIGLRVLGLARRQAGAPRARRNDAQVPDRPAADA